MSAHINRDLPFVIAAVGTVAPDGSSRKLDYDKVEEWLNKATEPMLEEASQRYDPTLNDANDPWGHQLPRAVPAGLAVAGERLAQRRGLLSPPRRRPHVPWWPRGSSTTPTTWPEACC